MRINFDAAARIYAVFPTGFKISDKVVLGAMWTTSGEKRCDTFFQSLTCLASEQTDAFDRGKRLRGHYWSTR